MQLGYELTVRQTTQLTMTPALRQALNILQLPGLELLDFLQEQVAENPLLEGEFPDRMLDSSSSWKERREGTGSLSVVAEGICTLEEHLLQQAAFLPLTKEDARVLKYLIGNLNDRGYVSLSVEEMAQPFAIGAKQAEEILGQLHTLDPPGIGARNLRECLLLQIQRQDWGSLGHLASLVVESHLESLADGQFTAIGQALGISLEEVLNIVQKIRQLNPFPAAAFPSFQPHYIVPDVMVIKGTTDYEVQMNESLEPTLRISPYYQKILREGTCEKDVSRYLQERLKAALWVIKSIEQRRNTIQLVTESIVDVQRDFLDWGLEALQPLTLREVAEWVGVHESTVSRAIRHKYMQTPRGVYEFKFFFGGGYALEGEGKLLTVGAVKKRIKEMIGQEDKIRPLSDQKLTDLLEEIGIRISRRTVMKYREELAIPSSRNRKNGKGLE